MAEVFNQTPFKVFVVPLSDKEGQVVATVIAKGTYAIQPAGNLEPAPEQIDIVFVNEFNGDPATASIRIPSDLCDFKPATDVLVISPAADPSQTPLYGRKIAVEVGPIRVSGRVGKTWDFGPVRPDAKPRKGYAGTYDQSWAENRMPLLPRDFDPRFHQVAPPGQIAKGYLHGDERVRLNNLYEDGKTIEFRLPGKTIVVAGNVLSHYFTEVARLDTVLVWTHAPLITLVWRHVIKPRQKFEEVCNVFVYLVRLRTIRELFGAP
jgi:hypothetical protein